MREILADLLWIGNAVDGRDVKIMFENRIGAVIHLAIEELPEVLPRELVYCRFPLIDGQGNSSAIIEAAIDMVATLIAAKVPTLISCGGGMSRSPAIAAAVLARTHRLSLEEAMKQVAATGPHDVTPLLWHDVAAVFASL